MDRAKDLLASILEGAEKSHTNALLITQNGITVGEFYSGNKSQTIETMSVTKSIVSMAIGVLMQDGRLNSLDKPLCDYFPEWANSPKSEITIRHLMTHSSGLEDNEEAMTIFQKEDSLKYALDARLEHKPGTNFHYNNRALQLLPMVIERTIDGDFYDFIQSALLRQLGIKDTLWRKDRNGHYMGFAGFSANAHDLTKLAQLMLQGGEWQGRQILSKQYIEQAISPSKIEPDCGLLWWLDNAHPFTFAAAGALGQSLIVCPKSKIISVRQIAKENHKADDDNFFEILLLIKELSRISPQWE